MFSGSAFWEFSWVFTATIKFVIIESAQREHQWRGFKLTPSVQNICPQNNIWLERKLNLDSAEKWVMTGGTVINACGRTHKTLKIWVHCLTVSISQITTRHQKEDVSITKGLYVIIDIETIELSKTCHHIIKIDVEFLTPYGTCVNNGKFNSLVKPTKNINPIITKLTGILNGDVEDGQEFLVVGKEFIMFLKCFWMSGWKFIKEALPISY